MSVEEYEQKSIDQKNWGVVVWLVMGFAVVYSLLIVRNLLLGLIAANLVAITYLLYEHLRIVRLNNEV